MSSGFLIIGDPDPGLLSRAKSKKVMVESSDVYSIPFTKTLIVQAGTRIPWDLIPAAWNFLNRWDAAVPLWRYGKTAADVGSSEDRQKTKAIVRDLRVLLHSVELLFVRKNEAGSALIETLNEEIGFGGDPRLAFLRSIYLVKPRLCVLPTSWMAEVRDKDRQAHQLHRNPRTGPQKRTALVKVEVGPGRFVKCVAGDEDRVLSFYREQEKN